MGGDTFSGANEGLEEITKKEPFKALVVEDVRILKRTFIVDVPKYKTVDQIKYNTLEENTTKYNKVEEDTTEFIRQTVGTIEFIRKEEDTIKYNVIDKECERPVIVDKEYIIATYKDVGALKALLELMPTVIDEMKRMKEAISKLKDVKLIPETKRVPDIKWIPTETPRIIWVDQERCTNCGKEIK